MKRLVVVSNRVADLTKPLAGGLAVGIGDALKSRGGVWMGWNGRTRKDDLAEPSVRDIGKVRTVTIPLSTKDYEEYYLGFANRVLWPLLHYRLDLVEYRSEFLDGYRRVNLKFAEALLPILRDDDMVWAHDYHLVPLAGELRKHGCRQRMGFFLHIPFPSPEIIAAVPHARWLVESLLKYDVVGFQTETDAENLRRFAEEHLDAKVSKDGTLRSGEHSVTVGSFPIGIDVDAFAAMARQPNEAVEIETMRRRVLSRKQIIGVDRLDYTKGLPERFKAYNRLLELYPDLRKKVVMMQIAPPTREDLAAYTDIRDELESLSGAINGRFADFNWTPLRYIHRNIPRETLAALFRAGQVGFITPLRDGMNLVAKEYIAAQNQDDPGVLVLSKFAGAAEDMAEALIVNPYDIDDMARNLHRAITMPREERVERQKALLARIRRHDAKAWLDGFLAVLEERQALRVA